MSICPLCKAKYDDDCGTRCGDCDTFYACNDCYTKYLDYSTMNEVPQFRKLCGHSHESVDLV